MEIILIKSRSIESAKGDGIEGIRSWSECTVIEGNGIEEATNNVHHISVGDAEKRMARLFHWWGISYLNHEILCTKRGHIGDPKPERNTSQGVRRLEFTREFRGESTFLTIR